MPETVLTRRKLLAGAAVLAGAGRRSTPSLGIAGTRFTLNERPVFLYGISYYGALGGSGDVWKRDLEAMREHRFNWIRAWATWSAFENNLSVVEGSGKPRPAMLERLRALVDRCGRLGMVVDVTLHREKAGISSLEAHREAVRHVANTLRGYRNWYLDLANERNIGDQRFVPIADLAALRKEKVLGRVPVTASQGGDLSREDVAAHLDAGLDFLTPHRPRHAGTADETRKKTEELLAWARDHGKPVPVHYQEPFRRGYADWNPTAEDFLTDLRGAIEGGAAGWCFHNGDQRAGRDKRPRRSFDLRDGALFAQLDDEERKTLRRIAASGLIPA